MNSSNQWLIVVFSATLVLFLLFSLLYRYHIQLFIEYLQAFLNFSIKKNFFQLITLFTLLQLPFYFFFMPGFSLLCLLLAYIIQDVFNTVLLLTLTTAFLLTISFLFFSFLKRVLFPNIGQSKLVLQLKLKYDQRAQVNCSLIQFLMVPQFFKTISLLLLECDISTYFFHGMVWQSLRIFVFAIVGKNVPSIENFYKGNLGDRVETFEAMNIIGMEIVLTILAIFYLIYQFSDLDKVVIQTEKSDLKVTLKSVNSKTFMKEVESVKTNQPSSKSVITN